MRIVMAGLLGLLTPISALAEKPLPDPLAAGWQGESVCELLEEDDQHRMLRCTFPPGIGHERHFHAPHTGYTLAGGLMRITDDDGTREVNVPTGSSWISDGIEWHEIVNVGETTAAYLIIEIKPDEVLPTLSAG